MATSTGLDLRHLLLLPHPSDLGFPVLPITNFEPMRLSSSRILSASAKFFSFLALARNMTIWPTQTFDPGSETSSFTVGQWPDGEGPAAVREVYDGLP